MALRYNTDVGIIYRLVRSALSKTRAAALKKTHKNIVTVCSTRSVSRVYYHCKNRNHSYLRYFTNSAHQVNRPMRKLRAPFISLLVLCPIGKAKSVRTQLGVME